MRISDWSSDVCSSDLGEPAEARQERFWHAATGARPEDPRLSRAPRQREALKAIAQHPHGVDHSLLHQLQLSKDSLDQIGRASCRERVCQYVYISVVAGALQKKEKGQHTTKNNK